MKHLLFFMLLLNLQNLFADHEYRDYNQCKDTIKECYRTNHEYQTMAFVLQKKQEYQPLCHGKFGIWQVLEKLDQFQDESDPDLSLSQLAHALQTAEALRKDNYPRWLILTGLIHDCGKMLSLFGEPQWAVVGDTFPVGCAFSDQIVYPELFIHNPDFKIPAYQTSFGIYSPGCGLHNLHMSWGHDEYLYYVIKKYLPEEAAYIIRYHSFYALHKQNAYTQFMNEYDQCMLPWLKLFNQYDLYSKCHISPDIEQLKPYYQELIAEFFPDTIEW